MDRKFFAELLERSKPTGNDMESFWDGRARQFDASKRTYGSQLTNEVVTHLKNRGALTSESSVLDIGCASGRYAIPFALEAREVLGMDVSSRMLELCRENAEAKGVDNISYVKEDWERLDIESAGWGCKFDLVFAAMCPVLNKPAALEKMSAASRGYCVVAQYIAMEDPLMTSLYERFGAVRKNDPHNGGDVAWATFNLLWLDGCNPEVTYFERVEDRKLGLDEALSRYSLSLEGPAKAAGVELADALAEFCENGEVHVRSKTTLSLICWKPIKEEFV